MNKQYNSVKKLKKISGISAKLLDAYVYWQGNTKHIPKMLRYSMGVRIDSLFAEIVELVYISMFSPIDKKILFLDKANIKNDLLKFMLNTLFELKGIKENVFIETSSKMEEIGRMFYGWKMRIEKENQIGRAKAEPIGKDKK